LTRKSIDPSLDRLKFLGAMQTKPGRRRPADERAAAEANGAEGHP
jgi:hypothetical protein